jgi:two-component system LytT family response regulator
MLSPKINCLIIDDEYIARELIGKYLKRVPYLELLGSYSNPIEGIYNVQQLQPDLIFLDIEMPEMNGFDFLNALKFTRPSVIMITADPSYALLGFDYQISDYLLKPVSFDRFMQAIKKVINEIPYKNIDLLSKINLLENSLGKSIQSDLDVLGESVGHLILRVDRKLIKVKFEEIYFIEAMKDYLKVYWISGVSLIHMTMSKIEELLPTTQFLRVNRSYIVRMAEIKEIEGSKMTIVHGRKIPIGVTYRTAVIAAFQNH